MTVTIPRDDTAFRASVTRVARHFPQLARTRIDAIMRGEYAALADRPIQIYVTNLVEHDTRAQLTRETHAAL